MKAIAILFALIAVSSKNTVNAIVLLIGLFVIAAAYLCNLGASYLGLVYIIVYVGAISVLFLFVIMMLDLRVLHLNIKTMGTRAFPLALVIAGVISTSILSNQGSVPFINPIVQINNTFFNNYEAIQNIAFFLYTEGAIWMILLGLLFLVGIIGPIVLCLRTTD